MLNISYMEVLFKFIYVNVCIKISSIFYVNTIYIEVLFIQTTNFITYL